MTVVLFDLAFLLRFVRKPEVPGGYRRRWSAIPGPKARRQFHLCPAVS